MAESPLGRIARMVVGADIAEKARMREQRESVRSEFNRSLKEECIDRNNDFLDRMMELMGDGARRVAEDAIDQAEFFWRVELNKAEEEHALALKLKEEEMRVLSSEHERELHQADEQVSETVQTYNRAVADLTAQVAELKAKLTEQEVRGEARCCELATRLELQEKREEEKVARLTREIQGSEDTLEGATRTFKGLLQDLNKQLQAAQVTAREGDLKAQQKRLIYGQTLSSQQKQLEDTLAELDHTKALLEEQEARSRKLTALSQYLLAKHQQLVKSHPMPSSSASPSPPPNPPTPPNNSSNKVAEPSASSSSSPYGARGEREGEGEGVVATEGSWSEVGLTPSPNRLMTPPSSKIEGDVTGLTATTPFDVDLKDNSSYTMTPGAAQKLEPRMLTSESPWDPFKTKSVERAPPSSVAPGGMVAAVSPSPPPQTSIKAQSRHQVLKKDAADEFYNSPLRELERMLSENLGGSA